jgi:S1-C subfamily serine protease
MKPLSEIYNAVKKATVAIVENHSERLPNCPYEIVGSGFCIHAAGIVVTCWHVFEHFVGPPKNVTAQPQPVALKAIPQAMFFGGTKGSQVEMHPVYISNAGRENGFDLAVVKLAPHPAFPDGFPTVPILDYADVHEMMDIATCGFPLGNTMFTQLGTLTASFTKGMISSINPAPGIAREHVTAFQLDLTATNGNSGGPVFSLESGKVFGVLQGGAVHPNTGHIVQGITRAEPVYPVLTSGIIDGLMRPHPPMPRDS